MLKCFRWLAALLAVTVLGAAPVRGAEPLLHEWRFGLLAHDVDGLWAHSRRESGMAVNTELVFARLPVQMPAGVLRPNLGATLSTAGDTSKIYAGVLWQFGAPTGLFLDVGLGLAVHDGELDGRRADRKRLGSRLLLRVPLEVGYSIDGRHRLSVLFDHISNAYLASPNEGLDTLGVRYGYRF